MKPVVDVDYTTVIRKELPKVNGKRKREVVWACPYYVVWQNLHTRIKNVSRRPCYSDLEICEDWYYLSKFKAWMQTQDWVGKELDKDLLGNGKLYSPDTCCFLSSKINVFIGDKQKNVNGLKGIIFQKDRNKYPWQAQIMDLFTGKQTNLGRFTTAMEAHLAWKAKKHEFACILAEPITDSRIKHALMTRYI